MSSIDQRNEYRKESSSDSETESSGFQWPRVVWRVWVRRGLIVAMSLAILLVGWDFYRYTNHADRYRVEMIVQGNEAVKTARIRTALLKEYGVEKMPSLLTVSASRVQALYEQEFDRFTEVDVSQQLPNKLIVSVEEREPYVLVGRYSEKRDGRIFLPADKNGVVFEPEPHELERIAHNLPVVLGLEIDPVQSDQYQDRWKKVRAVIQAVQTAFPLDIVQYIEVRPGGFTEITIKRPQKLEIRLGLENYPEKIQKLRDFMGTKRFQQIRDWINLSNLDNIRVR